MKLRFYLACFGLVVVFLLVATASIASVGLYMWVTRDLPDFKKLTDYEPNLVTTVYARDGQVLGYLYKEKRFLVQLQDVPAHVVQAFLAMEDHTFYEHKGVDFPAILRAALANYEAGTIVQGASTINQQIIKQLLLTSQKKYERKLKEAVLAFRLDSRLTKDEILTIYLNQVFFGAGSYGVEAAAQTFFGKHVGELTLAEGALLAGMPKAPSLYNPYTNPDKAHSRKLVALARLHELGWITTAQYEEARRQPLVFRPMPDPSWGLGAYYLEEVRRQLIEAFSQENVLKKGIPLDRYGEDAVYEKGLHVYTAVDLQHQAAAEMALRFGLEEYTRRHGWSGPLAQLNPEQWKDFLAREPTPGDLEPGKWLQALVVGLKNGGAELRMGSRKGFIPAAGLAWARWKKGGLRPGDVVWVSVEGPDVYMVDLDKAPADQAAAVRKLEDLRQALAREQVLLCALREKPLAQGAIISMEPPTGDVVAVVGGYDFNDSWFNRATQARRQPGSAFKPIVFSAALEHGLTPNSIVLDSPITIGTWSPKNYGGGFLGPMPMRVALAKSRNLVTVRMAAQMGIRKVIAHARKLGLEGEFPPYLPISLGAQVFTPLNLAQAYSAFARDGSYVKPRFIHSVRKAWGEEVLRIRPEAVRAISPENAYAMATMLQGVVQAGTGTRARVLNRPVAGKTGTTNNEIDTWFMGFSPYLLTGVYVGFDELTPMGKGETGGRTALPIWVAYRLKVEENYPVQDFRSPQLQDQTPTLRMAATPVTDDLIHNDFIAFPQVERPILAQEREPAYGISMSEPGPSAASAASTSASGSAAKSKPVGATTSEELLKSMF
ncbi:MAG: PBP1A family penicillin-binding protein [Desulfovibrio sp.]|nr:PBP1A family penicillin-binding protein [Desulfovibrio sp.]MCA1985096.1 PBP1A family penicillin-binding protein [Desulfovibrio sp.]